MEGVRHTMSASDSRGLFDQQHGLLPMCALQVQGGSLL